MLGFGFASLCSVAHRFKAKQRANGCQKRGGMFVCFFLGAVLNCKLYPLAAGQMRGVACNTEILSQRPAGGYSVPHRFLRLEAIRATVL